MNDTSTINLSEDQLVNVLLFGSEEFTLDTKANILKRTIGFLKGTERFNNLLLQEQTFVFNFHTQVSYYVQDLLRALHASVKFCVLLSHFY